MSREQIENLVESIVKGIISETDLELVDVEYVKEREWYLRVFLDKEGGLEVEDCQWVSGQLEDKLDELDPIKGNYYLEISSPGLDRALKKERDFTRHSGDKVDINLFVPIEGQKTLVGTLVGLVDGIIHLNVEGTEISVSQDKVAQVRLHIDF